MVKSLKVLYVDTGADFWGGQRSLYDLISRLDRGHYEPTVVVPENSLTRVNFEELTKVYTFPASSASGKSAVNPISIVRSIYTLFRLIGEIKPDIIHANTFLAGLIISLIPFLNTQWILHQRDLTDHGRLSDWVARRATKIITVSSAAAGHFGRNKLKSEPTVIPDGVSFSFIDRIYAAEYKPVLREKLGIREDTLVVGTVGTISEQKSQHELLLTANNLRDIPGLHFLCIGEPYREDDYEYYNGLKKLRAALNLEHLISFEGFIDDLAAIYGCIDILAHPAKREGLGRVIIEAMGAGIPVLAKNCSGPAEIITDGVDGILCDPGDPECFTRELKKLVEDETYRKKLVKAAKEEVLSKYTLEISTQKIEKVYNELIASDRFT